MKKVILISALVVVATWVYNLGAVSLNDIPNEAAFPAAKSIINGNNAVINTNLNAIGSSITTTSLTANVIIVTNMTMQGVQPLVFVCHTNKFVGYTNYVFYRSGVMVSNYFTGTP